MDTLTYCSSLNPTSSFKDPLRRRPADIFKTVPIFEVIRRMWYPAGKKVDTFAEEYFDFTRPVAGLALVMTMVRRTLFPCYQSHSFPYYLDVPCHV